MAFFYHSYYSPFFFLILCDITRVFVSPWHDFRRKYILVDNTFVVFIFENLSAAFSYFVFSFILFSPFDSFYFCDVFSMALL